MSADVMDGVGVATGGTGGADGADMTVAGADEEGLNSEAGIVAHLAWVVKCVCGLRGESSSSSS